MEIIEVVNAYGHKEIQATHKSTFEITRASMLTRRGDCIIAVGATKGAVDLSPRFKEAARRAGVKIRVTIESGEVREVVCAEGNPQLSFTHPTDLVVRKSDYVCGRTVGIRADKAASDLSQRLVRKARDPHQSIVITLTVKST